MKQKMFRQGDLLIREIKELPENLKRLSHKILAEGEVTGHKHQFVGNVDVYENEKGQMMFGVMDANAKLVHQEHKPILIGKGVYEVIKEREYNPFEEEIKQVMD